MNEAEGRIIELASGSCSEAVKSARREEIRREEETPPGRAGIVCEEDLEATRHRIITGLPMPPMKGWAW